MSSWLLVLLRAIVTSMSRSYHACSTLHAFIWYWEKHTLIHYPQFSCLHPHIIKLKKKKKHKIWLRDLQIRGKKSIGRRLEFVSSFWVRAPPCNVSNQELSLVDQVDPDIPSSFRVLGLRVLPTTFHQFTL